MKWIFLYFMICCYSVGSAQPTKGFNQYLKSGNLMIIGQVVEILPDILQDDLGTSYGSVSVKCFAAFDLKTESKTECPFDMLRSLIYLSTNGNKPNIELSKLDFCLLFLTMEPNFDNQFTSYYKLVDENSIFELTPEKIKQLVAIQPKYKQHRLHEFIR